jgi:hypothetical protein
MDAESYNEKVWGSQEMREARHHVDEAYADLSDDARGWGKLVLESARDHLQAALERIQAMLNWE